MAISTTSPPTRLMTVDDLADLPGDYRYELIEGELIPMPPTNFEHGRISASITADIVQFVRQHRLGVTTGTEAGFRLSRNPDTLVAPDVAFVRAERVPAPEQQRQFADFAPDLAVEIVSPSDRAADLTRKVLLYLDAGTRAVWVVDPEEQVVTVWAPGGTARVLRASAGDTLDGGDVLPGFSLPLGSLFDTPPAAVPAAAPSS